MRRLETNDFLPLVKQAIREDVGDGDATTLATIPEDLSATAAMVARESLVVSGLSVAQAVFRELTAECVFRNVLRDAEAVAAGATLMNIDGPAQAILTGERVALNFMQRMCGIATLTARYVAAVQGTKARILDTRKTTPGWRLLEKYAVACGGGRNHRFGLHDRILIKDNHLAALRNAHPNPIAAAVALVRQHDPRLKVEVEADSIQQAEQAAAAGADILLLDNMSLEDLRVAVQRVGSKCQTEASGGITLERVKAVADTDVDFISVGALTHSAPASDIGLDFVIH